MLMSYHWPGNVRELENAIVRAAQSCSEGFIGAEDLDLPLVHAAEAGPETSFSALRRRAIEVFEREYLTMLMRHSAGNVTRAARAARKERRDFGRLLKKHGLDPRTFAGVAAPQP
jgi:two-component system response regulator GlrR